MLDSDVTEMVEQAQNPETFSFLDVVQGRGYPKDEVVINLDEQTAYQIQKLETRIADQTDNAEADRLSKELIGLHAKLAQSRFVFKITGVSTELKEQLLEQTIAKIPDTYDTNKNFMTGQVEKVKKNNPKQGVLFSDLLWQAMVEQIVAPSGAVDTAPSLETISAFRGRAPESQLLKFNAALEKLDVAAEAFEVATDSDF